jgi:hypothetical protein
MKLAVHTFLPAGHFEALLKERGEAIRNGLRLLSEGAGDAQALCRSLRHNCLLSGCCVLILNRPDQEAVRWFREAAEYGVRSLQAIGTTKVPRVYHTTVEIGEQGVREIATHEVKPERPRQPRLLSVGDYDDVLATAVCFGARTQMEEVARYPEDKYRNPDVIAGEDYYAWLRGLKNWLLGDVSGAMREGQEALMRCDQAAVREHIAAFLSLGAADEASFLKHLEKRLNAHKKQYQKRPNEPEGVYCQPALMLCRLAIDHGFAVEERPYLPVRLLPNHRGAVVH